jgi:hypothetical protein
MRRGTPGAVAVAVVAVLMVGVFAGTTPASGATRTLTPEEESAIPTADPAHMVPDEVMVQFGKPVSSARLRQFEERFHLTLLSALDFGDDGIEPYYQFQIKDGVYVTDKRLEIIAGEPLVAWCQPNIIGELAGAGGASTTSPEPTTSPTATAAATATPTPSPEASSAGAAGSGSGDPSPGPLPIILAVGAIAVAALAVGGLWLAKRRRPS